MHKAVIIQVFGRVQGVGFRYYTEQKAKQLKLDGFVQNKPDGSVLIEAEGDENQLNELILWCRKGPAWARVTDIILSDTAPLFRKGFVTR